MNGLHWKYLWYIKIFDAKKYSKADQKLKVSVPFLSDMKTTTEAAVAATAAAATTRS